MSDRETRCTHFNGLMHDCCKAGVNYRELAGEPELGMALRLPCTGAWLDNPKFDPAAVVPCPLLVLPTAEELAAQKADAYERMRRQAALTSDGNNHSIWQCNLCPGSPWPQFESAGDFVDHLVESHGYTRPVQSRREMSAHLDARDWHQTNYSHYHPETGALMGYESHRQARRGGDRARWGGNTPKGRKGRT